MNSVGTPLDPAQIAGESVPLADKRVRRIVNLHMVTTRGRDEWTITHCIGELSSKDPAVVAGADPRVIVTLPRTSLPRKGATAALITMFKESGRYAKVMDVFGEGVVSKCW